ncbi:MAG: hypothetical protein BGP12_13740 [Rhodospirillales bacterium 70-18]|nr:MAG: hypothetical protein BGP12_13740 [Rhodospirillales bacterium 70-18]
MPDSHDATARLLPDFRQRQASARDQRSPERLLLAYELEVALRARLMQASREERTGLYSEVYDILFSSLDDHPQKTRSQANRDQRVAARLAFLRPFLRPGAAFLEIGCGDALVSCAMAAHASRSYGLDVVSSLIDFARAPANFGFVPVRSTAIDLPDSSVGLAYSDQLIEHLHPDDARAQTEEVARVLVPGGTYILGTPNRATGPHDMSYYFDNEARGLHLQEFTYRDLRALLLAAGFSRVRFLAGLRGWRAALPYPVVRLAELGVLHAPRWLRGVLMRSGVAHGLCGITAIATK